MKQLITTAVLLLQTFLIFAQTGKKDCIITFKNNTDKALYVAIARHKQSENTFVSEGWYKVERYNRRDIALDGWNGETVYILGDRGEPIGNKVWGGDFYFCIDKNRNFTITDAHEVNCKTKKGFAAAKLRYGYNAYTFNP